MTSIKNARHNVLLIVVDDMGFSDIGSFGSEIRTPNLDALALEGVRLTDFHSASACSPTRVMLMTGVDHHLAGIGAMPETLAPGFDPPPGYEGYLNDQVVSVAELLRDAGYRTLISGKWHLGHSHDRSPHARGFDRSFALLHGSSDHFGGGPFDLIFGLSKSSGDSLVWNDPAPYVEDGRAFTELPSDFYSSDYFATRLIEFLEEGKDDDRPFFAYLPFSAPHTPLQAPDADIARYHGRYDEGPDVLRERRLDRLKALGLVSKDTTIHPVVTDAPEWADLSDDERAYSARTMEVYAAMVDNIDQNVGRVVDYLKSVARFEDTLVIFLSDNGAEGAIYEAIPILGPHSKKVIAEYGDNSLENLGRRKSATWYGPRWAQAATAPSRMVKGYTTEGGIRVPAFIRAPGGKRGGEISHIFSTVKDITPTLLDIAGTAHPGKTYRGKPVEEMSGRSLSDWLDGDADSVHPEGTATGWELFGRRAIRQGDWKAVYTQADGKLRWHLFDLGRDRGEVHDLSESHPEKLADLLKLWDIYTEENNVQPTPPSFLEVEAGTEGKMWYE